MMNQVLFSSAEERWATPHPLFDLIARVFPINLDVCALPENTKCQNYFTPEIDGLKQRWEGICWMNPPYGKVISTWIIKAYQESLSGATVVCLVPARTDTKWFKVCWNARYLIFLHKRVRFVLGEKKKSSPTFPSVLVIFTDKDWDLSTFQEIGIVVDMDLQRKYLKTTNKMPLAS
jgi:phage N-6-adenine-methyltransferase